MMKKSVILLALLIGATFLFITLNEAEETSAQICTCLRDPPPGCCVSGCMPTDPDCGSTCTPTEPSEITCNDNIDNDCDGTCDSSGGCGGLPRDTDCPDTCYPYEIDCTDGKDNDCDGDIDGGGVPGYDRDTDCPVGGCSALDGCCDPDCPGDPDCTYNNQCDIQDETAGTCPDHPYDLDVVHPYSNPDRRNDCRLTSDTTCRTEDTCPLGNCCTDGVDNDCNGLTDDQDPACCVATETPETSCNDGNDNDCDQLTDQADPDCGGGSCGTTTSTPCQPLYLDSYGRCRSFSPLTSGESPCACTHTGSYTNTCADQNTPFRCDINYNNCECVWTCDAGEGCTGTTCDPDLYCNTDTYCLQQPGTSSCTCNTNSDCCIGGIGQRCWDGNCYNECEAQGINYLCTPEVNTYENEVTATNIACPTTTDHCVTCPNGYTPDRTRNQCEINVCDDATDIGKPCTGDLNDRGNVENTDGYYCNTDNGAYCCPVGQVWSSISGSCTAYDNCQDTDSCPYDFDTQNSLWWSTSSCYTTSYGCCPAGIVAGEQDYQHQPNQPY